MVPTVLRTPLGRAVILVWLTTLLGAATAIPARATYGARVTADEPQYLLSALSLAEDLDLDIADEIAAERFVEFHEVRLNPQTIALNDAGQELSPHDPLLPVILAPAMGVGGWRAAKLVLAAIAATTAALTLWTAVRRFDLTLGPAAIVIGGLFLAPPLTSYGTQVYPEMPAALAVIAAVALLTGPRRVAADVGTALAVIALPWLSVKYAPVAAVPALALLGRHLVGPERDRRRAGLLAGGLAAAGVVYLVVHQRIYGGWTVYAAGDHFVDGEFLVVGNRPNYPGRSRRLIGLIVDRTFGLAAWTPTYLATPAAVVAALRPRQPRWMLLAATSAAGWAVATWVALTMHGWWWPGRQLVVILPLVTVAMAALVDRHRRLLVPAVVASALGTLSWQWLVVEASTGRRTLIVDFMETSNPWYRAWSQVLPDHLGPGPAPLLSTTLWAVLLAATAVLVRLVAGSAVSDPDR